MCFSVDRFCCLLCWTIPAVVYTSWKHQPGEQRLHLEGPEEVKHRSLAAHYHSRFYDFWREAPPAIARDVYDEKVRSYKKTDQYRNYPTSSNGIPTNKDEQEAQAQWQDPEKRRRMFQNIAGHMEV